MVLRCLRSSRIVLILLLSAAWQSNGLMFWVYQRGTECLGFDVHGSDVVKVSFDIMPEEVYNTAVYVMDNVSKERIVDTHKQIKGDHQFVAKHTGGEKREFLFCVDNHENHEISVSFSFRSGTNLRGDLATQDLTVKLERFVQQILEKLMEMDYQQEFSMRREEAHRKIAESTSNRVFFWSLVKLFAVSILLFIQVYYLRGYFEVKTVV